MGKQYQVTIWSNKGYKPVSCIITSTTYDLKQLKTQGLIKICQKRYWTKRELEIYGYTVNSKLYKISVISKEELDKQREEKRNGRTKSN